MFLLILNQRILTRLHTQFTFHNVSINSLPWNQIGFLRGYLHSTMFLLILHSCGSSVFGVLNLHSTMFLLILTVLIWCGNRKRFTFHNVSINSVQLRSIYLSHMDLHSTMFLLIPLFAPVSSRE